MATLGTRMFNAFELVSKVDTKAELSTEEKGFIVQGHLWQLFSGMVFHVARVGADAVERGHLRVHDHPSKYILRSPEAKKTGPTSDALRPTTDARRCRTSTGWRLVWRSDAGCQRRH